MMLYHYDVQRNMELVRAILLAVEACPTQEPMDLEIRGYTAEEIYFHVWLLSKAELLEAVDFSSFSGNCWKPTYLTWAGYDFIDAMKSDKLWKKTLAVAVEKTGSLSIEVLKQAIPIAIKALLNS